MTRHLQPRRGVLHNLFEMGIAAKGVFALFETIAGITLLWLSHTALVDFAGWLTGAGLVEPPDGSIAARVGVLAARFNADVQHFYALYLMSHGAAKLAVVTLLYRGVAFAYPIAITVFSGFVAYQLHEWQTHGSPMMLALSVFDAAVIGLTWREWRGA